MSTRAGLIVEDSKGKVQAYYKHHGHPEEMADDLKWFVAKLPTNFEIADFENSYKEYLSKTNSSKEFEKIPEKNERAIYNNQDVQLVYSISKSRNVNVDWYKKTRNGWEQDNG